MIVSDEKLHRALAARQRDGTSGRAEGTLRASGTGWRVTDIVCTSGPRDRPFEERHPWQSIAVVLAGSFRYRSAGGGVLLTPGSLLLGNHDEPFACGHDHGTGDRCVAFHYDPGLYQSLGGRRFRVHRLPPVGALSPTVAETHRLAESAAGAWEELAFALAGSVQSLLGGWRADPAPTASDERRIAQVVRFVGEHLDEPLDLSRLAAAAGMSRYHFLRMFRRVVGVSPHQYVVKRRLHRAALLLRASDARVADIAMSVGFGDVSNFNHAFRDSFGMAPRAYRRAAG